MASRGNNNAVISTTEMSTAGSKAGLRVASKMATNASKNAPNASKNATEVTCNRSNRQQQLEQPAAPTTGATGGNRSRNAWGDEARRKQIEATLHRDHWDCVPEYAEYATGKGENNGGRSVTAASGAVSGGVTGGPSRMGSGVGVGGVGGRPKKEVMKKKSDKNLKALALIMTIGKELHFSSDERIHLSTMFVRNFGAEKHPGLKLYAIDARGFQRIMHATFGITNEKIIEGLFRVFDFAGNNIVSEPEWIRGLSIFVRGKFEERLNVVWQVYDMNEDGVISREEMYTLLQDCLVKTKVDDNDTEEAVKDLVEMLFRKLDVNHDGIVDKEDFWTAVKEENLMLECCGQVFPSQRHIDVFEATFADEIAFKPV